MVLIRSSLDLELKIGSGQSILCHVVPSRMIASQTCTSPIGAGNVPATLIIHRSATHTVVAGKLPLDASQGAGTPSGIRIDLGSMVRSILFVSGLNVNFFLIILVYFIG